MPEGNLQTGATAGASGASLEEMRAKFAEVLGALDKILPIMEELSPILGQGAGQAPENGADSRVRDEDVGPYADPKNKKYPLRNDEEIRAAWDYIHVKKNGEEYSPEERKEVEDRIERAWKEHIDPKGPPEAEGGDESEEERAEREAREAEDAKARDEESEEERAERERREKEAEDAKARDEEAANLNKPLSEEEREIGMDEAVREISVRIASRDKLATNLGKHIGTFDCAAMDESQVAEYGCRKLGLNVPKGHEKTALNVYLSTHKAPSEQRTTGAAMDSKSGGWLNKQRKNLDS